MGFLILFNWVSHSSRFSLGISLPGSLSSPPLKRNIRERAEKPDDEVAQYESRLWWLLYLAPCLPVGLIGFAWTTIGPPLPWVASMVFVALVGIANYAIYMATIDYMICAYGPSLHLLQAETVGLAISSAGVLTIPATPFFNNIGGRYHIQYASTILCKFCPLPLRSKHIANKSFSLHFPSSLSWPST